MGKNSGRSTTGEAAVPYYLGSPAQEAAKHLRLSAARFLSERATVGDVDEAIELWHNATRAVGHEQAADGITDSQIRELWDEAKRTGNTR